jgi:inner membrane protein
MPSPLIHLAAAAAFAKQAGRRNVPPRWRLWATAGLFSMLPDLDVLPGMLAGNVSAYHNQATHSLLAGAVACITGTLVLKPFLRDWHHGRIAALLTACYGSHLLLDWLTIGRGLKLFWPFLHTRYAAPIPLFYGVRYSEGLFSGYHLITIATEMAVIAAGYLIYRLRSRRWSPPSRLK